MTLGEKNCAFIEKYCVVPEGDLVGKPVVLADYQKRFILDVYDNPSGTDTAILSMARKNAKTATIAFLVLCHLVGPSARLNSRIISGAMSRDQAAEVYNLASKTVMLSPRLQNEIRAIPSSKKLIGLKMNTEYQAISADSKTAHGKSPVVAILDEVGQIVGPKSDFVDAITTSQGAYDDALLIYISTQAATDADLLSILIDDAKKNKPAKTICHVYEAEKDAQLTDEKAWRAANPALGLFRSTKDMKKQAEKAARMTSFENTFRNLNLNQRVSRFDPFVSNAVWQRSRALSHDITGRVLLGGLDLSSKLDLTACVFVSEADDGILDVWPFFWAPESDVKERENRDKAPYTDWARQGYLNLTPGNSVNYAHVAHDIKRITAKSSIKNLHFDRWHIDFFKKECGDDLASCLLPFGQGYKDMSPALDRLEELLLDGKMRHSNHPILTWCASNATIIRDPAGNRKLDKSKSTGRIDGMVALAMAVAGASLNDKAGTIDDFLSVIQ